MPIEIRELNIKINVADKASKPGQGKKSAGKDLRATILDECSNQIADFYRKKEER